MSEVSSASRSQAPGLAAQIYLYSGLVALLSTVLLVALPRDQLGNTAPVVLSLAGFGLVVLAALFARQLVGRLEQLAAAAEAIGAGDFAARAAMPGDDELSRVGRAFDQMAERLEELRGTERELIANVSHELRTPLSRVRVVLELLGEGGDATETRERLREISYDLEELERLVDDVLTAARFEVDSAGLPLNTLASTDIGELFTAAASRFHGLYGRSHELMVEPPQPAATVLADPALLRRALGNLLDNARKYSPPGSRITLTAVRTSAGTLRLEVRDEGAGIDAADLQQLFRPFFRGDKSRSRQTGGVGLGLFITQRIVEAHRGRLRAESTPGRGTTMRIELSELRPKTRSA